MSDTPDIKADAKRVFDVLENGGIAMVPATMGYTIVYARPEALEKVFMAKKRGSHKRHAMGGSFALHKEIHVLEPQNAEIVRSLVEDSTFP
jgi:tRNA A37 threonylcarbamoyladenosine synthetase subunit TsaC/SUA5/YrdC